MTTENYLDKSRQIRDLLDRVSKQIETLAGAEERLQNSRNLAALQRRRQDLIDQLTALEAEFWGEENVG